MLVRGFGMIGALFFLDLHRRVADSEFVREPRLDLCEGGGRIRIRFQLRMKGRHGAGRAERPGVHMMHIADAGHVAHEVFGNRFAVDAFGRSFHQYVCAFLRDADGAFQDEESDEHGEDRICDRITGRDDDAGRRDRRDRTQHVAHHVKRCAAHVEIVLAAMQQPEGDDVDHEARHCDHEHRRSHHGCRLHDAAHGLDGDPEHDADHHDAVREGREDFRSRIAVGARLVGRTARQPRRHEGKHQRACIGQHVARIGEQRERARDNAAHRFQHHEAAGEPHGEHHALLVAHSMRVMAMGVGVRMIVVMCAHVGAFVLLLPLLPPSPRGGWEESTMVAAMLIPRPRSHARSCRR